MIGYKITSKINERIRLAAAIFCRETLHDLGMITDEENEKIHQRIRDYQDSNEIEISEAQLLSVELTYDDMAK